MPKITRITAGIAWFALAFGLSAPIAFAAPNTPTVSAQATTQLGDLLAAGPRLKAKHGFATEFLGPIYATVNGKSWLGDCDDYGMASPGASRLVTGSFTDASDPTVRAQTMWIENTYWSAGLTSRTYAAARKAAVNRLKDADFRYDWMHSYISQLATKDPKAPALSDLMITNAKLYAGPVAAKGSFTKQALPGGAGAITVTVTANGHPYPGQRVNFGLTGATITLTTETNASGVATAHFTRTGVAEVSFKAAAVTPEWRKANFTVPDGPRRQHLIRGGLSVTTPTGGSYNSKLTTTVAQDCAGICDGHPTMSVTAASAGSRTQVQAAAAGKVVASLDLKAGTAGTRKFGGVDGQHLVFRYRVQVAGKWSPWATSSTFTVVCPAWPTVAVTKTCACKAARSVTYAFAKPAGPRFYTASLTVDGLTQTAVLGTTITLASPIKTGSVVTASFVAYADSARTHQLSTGVLDAFTQN